mmetsp:Transcript_7624/g.27190  ORF Transcript_7624/g.27190 Transcript_7624/m.27190 type:complete len:111 (+) Transcript_7624:662-994(+)
MGGSWHLGRASGLIGFLPLLFLWDLLFNGVKMDGEVPGAFGRARLSAMGQVLARFPGREVGRDSVVLAGNASRSHMQSFHLLFHQRIALLLPLICPACASMQFSIHPICI